MIYLLLLFILVVAGTLWLVKYILEQPDTVLIHWNNSLIETNTINILAGLLISGVLFYITLRVIKHLLFANHYFQASKQARAKKKASLALSQGLVYLVEGKWNDAENLLINDVEHSPAPLFNYLSAAKAADLQEEKHRRDEHLKQACAHADNAQAAVTIFQTEMQLGSDQLEQARAGLITLLEEYPKHQHAKRLLAKVYYQQEDWKNLSSLLQSSSKQDIFRPAERQRYEDASLKGIFQMYASKEDHAKLKQEWKKLPATIKTKNYAVLRYVKALISAGESLEASKLIAQTLNKSEWDDNLIEVYGKMEHDNLNGAINQAEKWLTDKESTPSLVLALARLYSQNKLWGKARNLYESSLNQSPNMQAYLEFAELLQSTGDDDNAQKCYQYGLNFGVTGKAQPLIIQGRQEPKKTSEIIEEDIHVV